MAADLGRRARGPGTFAQDASGRRVACLGPGALLPWLTRGRVRGNPAPTLHQGSWAVQPGPILHGGAHGDGHGAWPATESRQGVDHRVPTPRWHGLAAGPVATVGA